MFTPTEIKNMLDKIIQQVNESFEVDRARIDHLESRIALLEKPPKIRTTRKK